MVHLVCGHSGTGKTRRMIEMANSAIDEIQGRMVFWKLTTGTYLI